MPKTATDLDLHVTDMHTAGEPVRIVTSGYPVLAGATILDKRREALEVHDHLRRALMLEPRGHAGMYGVIPVAASVPGAAIGALFMHNAGYSTMCGHATIALGRWLVETGQVVATEPVTRFALELPCGVVQVACAVQDGRVVRTSFDSVPAFVSHADIEVDVPGLGRVRMDIAYGGAFYAILPASRLELDFFQTPMDGLVRAAVGITDAIRAGIAISHPQEPDLGFLYGTILTDDAGADTASFNLCVFADGQVDRSPTGSGVTARMAADFTHGRIAAGVERRFFGPSGLGFTGSVQTALGHEVTVRVGGTSAFTGRSVFTIEAGDPLRFGFDLCRNFSDLAVAALD